MKRFAVMILLATFTGLFYVYEEVEAVKIGYEIRKLEQSKSLALDRHRALKYNIARLKAPETLERRLEAQRIRLQTPKLWQTLAPRVSQIPQSQDSWLGKPWFGNPPFFTKFFLGTAQAEAKESSR